MSEAPQIADAEWSVMEVVWEKSPIGAGAVIESLEPKTGWKPSTIKTLLGRLVKKGCLRVSSHGYRYEYEPIVTRDECLRAASSSFLDRFFGGASLPAVLHFAKAGKLRKQDLDELRRILDAEERRNG